MKVAGINLLAVIVAAIATYAVGFVIYGVLLTPEAWMASQGITQAQMDATGMGRLVYSPLLPIVTAVGMAILFKWGAVGSMVSGVKWGALIACLSALPAIWYGWIYGVGPITGDLIDSAHLLVGHVVAGAILGAWR